ncbi:hypothetical protein [Flavobacterium sp. GNP001]
MKKLISILILLVIYGCTEDGKTYYYTITNNSGVTVEIIPYSQQGVLLLGKKVILLNGESLSKKDFDATPGGGTPNIARAIPTDEYLTKVEFVFANSKKYIFGRCGFKINGELATCDDVRNIFRKEYNDEQTEVYTITPEDFQNATDCGGPCY